MHVRNYFRLLAATACLASSVVAALGQSPQSCKRDVCDSAAQSISGQCGGYGQHAMSCVNAVESARRRCYRECDRNYNAAFTCSYIRESPCTGQDCRGRDQALADCMKRYQ